LLLTNGQNKLNCLSLVSLSSLGEVTLYTGKHY
jgi:hypothetical protein